MSVNNKEIETIGFPEDETHYNMLFWLGGENYVKSVVENVVSGLRQQDAKTRIFIIECIEPPKFLSSWKKRLFKKNAIATKMDVTFPLRVKVVDSDDRCWNLYIDAKSALNVASFGLSSL